MSSLSPEDYANLPSILQVPKRPERKVVEHTPTGSFADTTHLEERFAKTYIPHLNTYGVQKDLNCEATESADGHSGAATHLIRMPGDRSDQITAVCSVHHARLFTNAMERGGTDVASRRIHPDDIQPHILLRGTQNLMMRTGPEALLHHSGLTGEDAIVDRKDVNLGKGGGKRTTAIEELNLRRPGQRDNVVEAALDHVKTHGGHNPPPTAAPTVDFDGEQLTLGESYAKVANLRRKSEPDLDPKRPGNTENYYMAGVKSPDGTSESAPTSTRRLGINKTGVPNPKGGRKATPVKETWDTSNQYKPGYTEEEMVKNPDFRKSTEERAAAGIPVTGIQPRGKSKTNNRALKVTMTQLPITPYPTEPVGALDDSAMIKFAKKSQKRSTDRSVEEIELNTEGDRLRKIEARKTKMAESRNKAFKVDWKDVPRPE
jgi:hypothetical protein